MLEPHPDVSQNSALGAKWNKIWAFHKGGVVWGRIKGWILMCFSSAFVFAFVWEDALFPLLRVHILLHIPSAQSTSHRNDLTLPKQTSWTRHAWFDVQHQLPCHSLVCWQTEIRNFMKVWPDGPSGSSRHSPCTLISVSWALDGEIYEATLKTFYYFFLIISAFSFICISTH